MRAFFVVLAFAVQVFGTEVYDTSGLAQWGGFSNPASREKICYPYRFKDFEFSEPVEIAKAMGDLATCANSPEVGDPACLSGVISSDRMEGAFRAGFHVVHIKSVVKKTETSGLFGGKNIHYEQRYSFALARPDYRAGDEAPLVVVASCSSR